MTKLCQVIAIEKSVKNKHAAVTTEAYQKMQKPALLSGLSRTYRPKDEDGELLPGESTRVQVTANELVKQFGKVTAELFDVTAMKDYTNCVAVADVTVGEVVVAKGVPVTYLLFLEKKLIDIHTFVSKLPTLDPSEEWNFDSSSNAFATKPTETVRSKKVPRAFERAKATDKHAAQVDLLHEDVTAGYWKQIKFSGALPAQKQAEMLERCEKLQRAVKFAREEANGQTVIQPSLGEKFFAFITG